MDDAARIGAEERLEILSRARAFEDLIHSAGWKYIFALHTEWVENARVALRKMQTGTGPQAADALRRWQIAEDLIDLESGFINSTLAQAREIRGGVTLDEALLMEQLQHEQSESRPDPTGY